MCPLKARTWYCSPIAQHCVEKSTQMSVFFKRLFSPHSSTPLFHLLSLNLFFKKTKKKKQRWKSEIWQHSQLLMVEKEVRTFTTSRDLQTLFHSFSSPARLADPSHLYVRLLACLCGSKYRHAFCWKTWDSVFQCLSLRRIFTVNSQRDFSSFQLFWNWTNTLYFSLTISPWNERKW